MIDLSKEQDIERLRQVALLQQRELELLHTKLARLCERMEHLEGHGTGKLELELNDIERGLNQNQPARLQRDRRQQKRSKKPQTGHGPTVQPTLDIRDELHTLDEADKVCPSCGGDLKEWQGQFEESELVDVVERKFIVRRIKRQKYRCQCGACVDTAEGPQDRLIAGGRYSLAFTVAVVLAKYLDHLPLERQVRQMARKGLKVTSQTLWDQVWRLAGLLEPTYHALRTHILAQQVIGMDQTGWPKLNQKGGKPWQMWCLTAPDAVFHSIRESKDTATALDILGEFTGTIVCDALATHGAAARAGPGFRLAHCWAHVHRKFAESEPDFPEAGEILDHIGELYAVDRRAREEHLDLASLRATESTAVLGRMHEWLCSCRSLPKSSLGRAVRYTLANWGRLTLFATDSEVWLDNNLTERSLRGPVIGRRNHFGSKSKRGTQAAAILYSLVETAKLRGVDPAAYLADAAQAALANSNTVTLPKEPAQL